jgi:hypothetical protein
MREAEVADLTKSVDEMTDSATRSFTDFDPIGSVRKEIESFSADPSAPTPAPETVSPEAAAPSTPAPVAPETTIPQPASADTTTLAPEAPQPKAGSGA